MSTISTYKRTATPAAVCIPDVGLPTVGCPLIVNDVKTSKNELHYTPKTKIMEEKQSRTAEVKCKFQGANETKFPTRHQLDMLEATTECILLLSWL